MKKKIFQNGDERKSFSAASIAKRLFRVDFRRSRFSASFMTPIKAALVFRLERRRRLWYVETLRCNWSNVLRKKRKKERRKEKSCTAASILRKKSWYTYIRFVYPDRHKVAHPSCCCFPSSPLLLLCVRIRTSEVKTTTVTVEYPFSCSDAVTEKQLRRLHTANIELFL